MATTPKKRSKKSKVTRTTSRVESLSQLKKTIATQEKTIATQERTIATQEKTIAAQAREIREAAEQQTATREILDVIANSPTDVQPVLDVVAANAARLCDATDAVIHRIDGDKLRSGARYGLLPTRRGSDPLTAIDRGSIPGRAVIDRRTLHIHDLAAEPEDELLAPFARSLGVRTVLATPLLREGIPIGTIHIRRTEVRPFTEKQIKLLETFAAQAVIAIENVRLFKELKESLEQQTATSEILGVIASSPTDLQPVLDAIAQSAARVCGSDDATIRLLEGDEVILAAHYGMIPPGAARRPLASRTVGIEAILQRKTVHIFDVVTVAERFPDSTWVRDPHDPRGIRTFLATPLLREGTAIGVINIRRTEVKPFTDKQVALLETFAAQAVIAIENARLFWEIQERNAELREALEHQTATAEVLGIISRSPTDVQPVLDAIVESAVRVCGIDDIVLRLREGDAMVARAHFGPVSHVRAEISSGDPRFQWMREHGALHIPDIRAQNDFPIMGSTSNFRTYLGAPLRQQGEVVGTLGARRIEVRPFTPAQIKLLETFADQAVIAIENVRLFNELKESLEQQTATSEILRVIASSPTDIQPVLNVVAENAVRVCGAEDASIRLVEGDVLRLVAHHGPIPPGAPQRPIDRSSGAGRAVVDRQIIHVEDLAAVAETEFPGNKPEVERFGTRTTLAVPLLREGIAIGEIHIRRTTVRRFSDKQISLLKTFADQAVIAIENVRLFKEIQERNAELREALEHQTATAEVLGIISRTPTDVQPVLDAIVESAARVCGIDDVLLRLHEGNTSIPRAHFGSIPIGRVEINIDEPQVSWIREHGTLHIPDVLAQNDFPMLGVFAGFRTFLVVPLRQRLCRNYCGVRDYWGMRKHFATRW
jgi:GAF domain-containing protein